MTLYEEFADLLPDYNLHSSTGRETDLLLTLIYVNELKSACDRVQGAVRIIMCTRPTNLLLV